ncbi:hypothetical protein T265_10830 [Opisthorchis viverrini]|uniref:Protein-serine O-palmitoleoyltransferase porcupine n=1 Tax=Opisthorchis viverrini TaxID=6198 RepID=A0A074ZBW9_OPIVI|nr:hypothetical protein T265_10830 [Opisthorchis viverrini]KER20685.1 hypothetical protein T265_10830 [Opisthorchis viverrini]
MVHCVPTGIKLFEYFDTNVDLSFQSDVRILRPPPPFQHRRPRRYKACLPPIDTFSHNNGINREADNVQFNRMVRKGLRRMFTETSYGLAQGTRASAMSRVWYDIPPKGRKPYVCEVCKRAYSRTSERSRCRKHHKLVSEIPTPTPVSTVVGLTALEVETAIDRARPRPYKCSICGDKRAYTDSGSLRKHMRRYHPGDRASEVKRSGVSGSQAKNGSTSQPACLAASSDNTAQLTNSYLMMQSNPPESDPKLIHFSTATPSNYTSHSAPTVVPISLYDPVGTSHEVFLNTTHPNLYALYVVDQPDMPPAASEVQFESTHQTVPYVGAANTEGAPPVNSPMNLCNSDVCATAAVNEVCDLSTNLDLSSHPEARMLSGFGAPSSTSLDVLGCFTVNGETFHGQEDALDLTESQYFTASGSNETAIDLSGDASFGFSLSLNPVDLSAPHQNYPQLLYEQDTTLLCATSEQNRAQNSLLNWDPEPGFSFTDLLTNTDLEETDTVFNISASVGQEVPLNYSPAKPVLPLSAAKWLREDCRIIGRASYSVEMTAKSSGSSSNVPNRLPVRLSFEETAHLLNSRVIGGLTVPLPISQVNSPTSEQKSDFAAAVDLNRKEMQELFQAKRRLELSGYYGQLVHGLAVSKQRHARGGDAAQLSDESKKHSAYRISSKSLGRFAGGESTSRLAPPVVSDYIVVSIHAANMTALGYIRVAQALECNILRMKESFRKFSMKCEVSVSQLWWNNALTRNFNSLNLYLSSVVSVRQRRKMIRLHKKRLRSSGCDIITQGEEDDHMDFNNSEEDSDVTDAPTLTSLIDYYDRGRTAEPVLNEGDTLPIHENYEDPIPRHNPRPTPLEWIRPGEVDYTPVPDSVLNGGLCEVASWLFEQLNLIVVRSQTEPDSSIPVRLPNLERLRLRCRVFSSLWSKGFYITTSSAKMGGDFLVYPDCVEGFSRIEFMPSVSRYSYVVLRLLQVASEFAMDPEKWHQERGSVMIVIMKAVSFSFDLKEPAEGHLSEPASDDRHLTSTFAAYRLISWLAYSLCPASLIFGPWFSFFRHQQRLFQKQSHEPTDWYSIRLLVRSFAHVLSALTCALFSLLWSTCLSNLVLSQLDDETYYYKWLNAYLASQSFRFSNYFVSYSSEAFLAALGIGYINVDSTTELTAPTSSSRTSSNGPIHVTHMLSIEFPRSLVDVVVNWNLPMHSWLKQLIHLMVVFENRIHEQRALQCLPPCILFKGLNFQLSAVLLSIGMFAYIEFVLRERLSAHWNACVASRSCGPNCGHVNKNQLWVQLCNLGFSCLAAFQLAYLAVMFDSSEQQAQGYSMRHVLSKWSELGFVGHYVALATYLFAQCLQVEYDPAAVPTVNHSTTPGGQLQMRPPNPCGMDGASMLSFPGQSGSNVWTPQKRIPAIG